ncbi:hypothetical protein KCP77_12735 [Salmonella enterica subsp. enterica]|nr:hypothetical protein KCP77_12735 [Salmonella enterica subsp. enterica]
MWQSLPPSLPPTGGLHAFPYDLLRSAFCNIAERGAKTFTRPNVGGAKLAITLTRPGQWNMDILLTHASALSLDGVVMIALALCPVADSTTGLPSIRVTPQHTDRTPPLSLDLYVSSRSCKLLGSCDCFGTGDKSNANA